jgi:VWFA-related protein
MKAALLLVTAISMMFLPSAIAQDFVVNVNLTMVDVFVEDQSGRPVLDLTANDFEILENNQILPVKHFSLERDPIAIGIALDTSSSLNPVRKEINRAASQLSERLLSGDHAFLVTFAGSSRLSVAPTKDLKQIPSSIRKVSPAFGTRFYDAIIYALQYLDGTLPSRKALVIFSDGADHYSSHSFEEAATAAVFYGYPVYFFAYIGEDSRTQSAAGRAQIFKELEQIAALTGGMAFFPAKDTDCARIARDVIDAVGYSYKIGFYRSDDAVPRDPVVRLRGEGYKGFRIRIAPDGMSWLSL